MKNERTEIRHGKPTFKKKIEKLLAELGKKDPKTPVKNTVIAGVVGCTRQHASRVRGTMEGGQAGKTPPRHPSHRPKGVSRANRPVVEALKRRAGDTTASRQETVTAVISELGLDLENHGRVNRQVTNMIKTGDFPRRNALPLTGRAREEARDGVVRLIQRGHVNSEIAKKLEISRTQVRNLRKEARERGRLQKGKRGRRKKKR